MKTVEVVAAVIMENGRIFTTARGYGEFKGRWEFPGGKIEKGETPEDALKREIKEELDTDIEVDSLIDIVEYDYSSFHLKMFCFLARIISGELSLSVHEDAKWLSKDQLFSVDWLPADRELIGTLDKMMGE